MTASRMSLRVWAVWRSRRGEVYGLVANKYYVDEIVNATFIKGSVGLGKVLSWVDANIVDGLVLLVGRIGKSLGSISAWIDRTIVDGAVNFAGGLTQKLCVSLRSVMALVQRADDGRDHFPFGGIEGPSGVHRATELTVRSQCVRVEAHRSSDVGDEAVVRLGRSIDSLQRAPSLAGRNGLDPCHGELLCDRALVA